MTQKTWSTVEVSAYLDGELEPERQIAFEAAMAQDATLRRRVEEMQQVVSLMRAVPLRESPRNYLLTPAMVAEAAPKQGHDNRRFADKRKRVPFLVMRLATSLVALAFVVSFGLTALQRNLLPSMTTGTYDNAESARLMQEADGLTAQEEAPAAPEEEPAAELRSAAPERPTADAAPESLSPEEEMALNPMPPSGEGEYDDEGGTALGMGGGSESEEGMVGITEASPPVEATPGPEGTAVPGIVAEDLQEAPESDLETEAMVEEALKGDNTRPSAGSSGGAEEPELEEYVTEESEVAPLVQILSLRSRSLPWLSIGLGAATVILGAVTFWMSRRES